MSPWLQEGWEEHWAHCGVQRVGCVGGMSSEEDGYHGQGGSTSAETCEFSSEVHCVWEVCAGTAVLLRSLQRAQISGKAAVKIEFMTWGNFIPSPCSLCSFKGWLEPSVPACSGSVLQSSGCSG